MGFYRPGPWRRGLWMQIREGLRDFQPELRERVSGGADKVDARVTKNGPKEEIFLFVCVCFLID